eukprot:46493_1
MLSQKIAIGYRIVMTKIHPCAKAKRHFFYKFRKQEVEEFVLICNESFAREKYELDVMLKEHTNFKIKLYNCYVSGMIVFSWIKNQKVIFEKFGFRTTIHNEVFSLFVREKQLFCGCTLWMNGWSRSEATGCVEGNCEGDVNKMNKRVKNSNRHRLKEYNAALEHELNEYIDYFTGIDIKVVDDIYMDAAIEHKNIWGYPLVCDKTMKRRAKKGIQISPSMDTLRNPMKFESLSNFASVLNSVNECDVVDM